MGTRLRQAQGTGGELVEPHVEAFFSLVFVFLGVSFGYPLGVFAALRQVFYRPLRNVTY